MIDHKHKFIFVHPNKCGGNSIEYFFQGDKKVDPVPGGREPWGHHTRLRGYQKGYPQEFKNYFKFGFSRNPFDRLVSVYHGRTQGKMIQIDAELAEYSFKECVKLGKIGTKHCKLLTEEWFTNENGDVAMDFIGKVEKFQQDFDIICDKIGIPRQELPHKNKSRHKPYTEYYDDETREIVAKKYAKDIDYFGYRFGG